MRSNPTERKPAHKIPIRGKGGRKAREKNSKVLCTGREGLNTFPGSLASESLTSAKGSFLLNSHPLWIVHLTFKTGCFTLWDECYLFCFHLEVYWGVLIKESSQELTCIKVRVSHFKQLCVVNQSLTQKRKGRKKSRFKTDGQPRVKVGPLSIPEAKTIEANLLK